MIIDPLFFTSPGECVDPSLQILYLGFEYLIFSGDFFILLNLLSLYVECLYVLLYVSQILDPLFSLRELRLDLPEFALCIHEFLLQLAVLLDQLLNELLLIHELLIVEGTQLMFTTCGNIVAWGLWGVLNIVRWGVSSLSLRLGLWVGRMLLLLRRMLLEGLLIF